MYRLPIWSFWVTWISSDCEYFQRMYRYDIDETLTICAFERATKTLVKPERWTAYEKSSKKVLMGLIYGGKS